MLLLVVLAAYFKIYGIIAFEISINENRSGFLRSNDTTLECSFNKAEGEDVLTLFFSYKNNTLQIYENIVIFTSTTAPRLTANGQYLSDRINLPNQTLTSSPAKITFSDLQCTDEASYKCNIIYQIRRTFKQHTVESQATQITVHVLPDKPQLIAFVNRPTIPTSTPTATTTSMYNNTSLVIMEGDNVTFVCSGKVGKPPGRFVFQKFHARNILVNTYTNEITHVTEIEHMCFFFGKSNLSIPIMSEDNQAIVRCIVDSFSADESQYENSPTIEVVSNKSTTPSRTTIRPPGSDNRKVPLIAGIAATSVPVFLILLICVLRKKRKQNKEPNHESNLQKEDMYAISQEGEYDKLGERRHKQEKELEHFDVAYICSDLNRPIASKDSNMLNCNARPGGKSNPGGYESVLIDGDIPVLSPGSKGFDRDEVEIAKKYMSYQKKEEDTTNAS